MMESTLGLEDESVPPPEVEEEVQGEVDLGGDAPAPNPENPFTQGLSTTSTVYFDPISTSSSVMSDLPPTETQLGTSQLTPTKPTEPVPPEPVTEFGIQSMVDLDIGSPPQESATQPASRFESKAVGSTLGGNSGAGTTLTHPDLAVSVTNPSKVGEGISAHFTYEVQTKTSLPQYQFGQFCVTRRFRDFVWLHGQLCAQFPGAIVPPLPEKHAAQVQTMRMSGVGCSAEWLESRRLQLHRFMQRVTMHPFLHAAPDLQTFLEAAEEVLEAWKESAAKSKPPTYTTLVSDVKQGLLSSYSKSLSLFASEPPPAFTPISDVPCQQMAVYCSTLLNQITAVHKHSKTYIDRHRVGSTAMAGFGLSLTQLANCESEINSSLAKGLSQMGLAVDRLSTMLGEHAGQEAEAFEEPMKDYIRLLGQCKGAIAARELALKTFNAISLALVTKRDLLEKSRAKGGTKEDRLAVMAREAQELEQSQSCAKHDYERVAARVDAEMARFQQVKLADFKSMLVRYVTLQLEQSKRSEAAWQELLPQLEAINEPTVESSAVDTSAEPTVR